MRVYFDIECNGLDNPTEIWLIVAKDMDTAEYHIFRNVTSNPFAREEFLEFAKKVTLWVGHHILGYDVPVLRRLVPCPIDTGACKDTLICSKLVDYSRATGHSVESYGEEFGFEKGQFYKWTDPQLHNVNSILFKELEKYCVRDVDIVERIYRKYNRIWDDPAWQPALDLEQRFQGIVNALHSNGFSFNVGNAKKLLEKVTKELGELDEKITEAFPPRTKCIREYTPKLTKHGTLSRTSLPRGLEDYTCFTEGASFCTFVWDSFNPSSHKQLIEVLAGAGWQPVDKTQTHIDTERELQRLKYSRKGANGLDIEVKMLQDKILALGRSGWKINENNLSTLPPNAPATARLLAKRILLEARRRTLTEWLALVKEDGRIHGRYYGIGAWSQRMSHQSPNTANIPNELDTQGKKKLYGKEMRSFWCAPKGRLLVGVDAEGIQLRIFAHIINDLEFTDALVRGRKDDKTDPHSLNQRIIGSICKSRAAAKRFIYALLLGAGLPKLAQILECSVSEAREALDRLLEKYSGWARLKREDIPRDGRNGWFLGLDGRKVKLPGETPSSRSHLAMSGYLQSGEAIIVKRAALKWHDKLKDYDALLTNIVHDEYVVECPNNVSKAVEIAKMMADSLVEVGEDLKLKCPLAGSYFNADTNDYTVGTTWYSVH